MVRRSSDAPRGLGRVKGTEDALDETNRAVARGSTSLRNNVGHRLLLDPASPTPLVTPTLSDSQSVDSALKFRDGGLEVRDPTDSESRDFSARSMRTDGIRVSNNAIFSLTSDGAVRFSPDGAFEVANQSGTEFRGVRTSRLHANDILANNEIRAVGGIRAEGGLSCGTRAAAPNWSSSIFDGAITWSGPPTVGALMVRNYAGTEYRGIFASNFVTATPSWRRLKMRSSTLDDYLGKSPGALIDDLHLDDAWTYDPAQVPTLADGTVHIGPALDEVPDKLRDPLPETDGHHDLASWNTRDMLVVALAELQRLRRRVAELETRTPEPIATGA